MNSRTRLYLVSACGCACLLCSGPGAVLAANETVLDAGDAEDEQPSETPKDGEGGAQEGDAPEGEGDAQDSDEVVESIEVIAHYDDADNEDTRARETLGEAAIERAAGDDLAKTLAQVAGVQTAGGTAATNKMVIRGQQERRLLVLYDGVRHESQKWGPDHAMEIDPFSAGTISVIKGAAGARYGADAIGGVVLVEPPPLRSEPGIGGKALLSFNTNGLRPYGAVRVDAAPAKVPGLAFRLEGNAAIGTDLRAPDYVLGNTASRAWNLGGAVGYRWSHGSVTASWHHHDLRAGVFYGVNIATPVEFQANLDAPAPVTADLWTVNHEIDRPRQAVTHEVGLVKASFFGAAGELEATYAFQANLRKEFDRAREAVVGPQYNFTLRTHSLDVMYRHPELRLPFGNLQGAAGLQGMFQENVYRGISLIPSFRGFSGGAFVYERLWLPRVCVELGARFDGLLRSAFLRERDFEALDRRDSVGESDCTENPESVRCRDRHPAASATAGLIVHVVPHVLDLKLDISSASRFPNIDELYMLGTAPTFPVFANGDPGLGVETAWGSSLTVGLQVPGFTMEVSGYGQLVDDFIYFAPELTDDGHPRFDVTIRGAWPTYSYSAINAVFYGIDGTLSVWPEGPVGLDVRGSLVRAQDRSSGAHLVGVPPDRVDVALIGRPPSFGPVRDMEVRFTADLVGEQVYVDPAVDIAPPPPGFALLGASVEATVGTKTPLRLGVDARNLLNTNYREYTSLLRYYADQPGVDVRVRVGVDF